MRLCIGAIFALAAILVAPLASAQPVNLRGRLIDPNAPYLQQVATLQTLRERGYLAPTIVSTQMFPTLETSLTTLRASRFGGSLHPRAIADELEANWIWWSEGGGDGPPHGGEPFPISFYLHNRTDRVVSGVIVELADRDCDFRSTATKAYHIISFGSESTLRPNDAAIFESQIATRAGMFASTGGLWCITVVRAF